MSLPVKQFDGQQDPIPQSPLRLLLARIGYSYPPLALVARLPFAMMVVGVLTLVVSARGSVQLGGVVSAMAGLGIACFGPFLGAAADRYGQRPVLLLSGAVNSVLLGVFTWVTFSPAPDWGMMTIAFFVGASVPQISPMSRSRLVMIVAHDMPVQSRPRLLSATLAYESSIDEMIFVFGPVIVGLLATTLGAGAPVIGAAILTLIFVSLFALHHTSAPAKSAEERAATLAPASELWLPPLLVTVVGIFGIGLFFGATLTSLTSFMQARGNVEGAGLLYGVLGVGSAVLALGVVLLPYRFSLRARWLVFSLLIILGGTILQFVDSEFGIAVCLLIMGFGIGPTLVNLYSFGAQRSPIGRSATVMTMLGSAIMVGQSTSTAITGVVADHISTQASMLMVLGSAVFILLAGVVNWWLTPSRRDH